MTNTTDLIRAVHVELGRHLQLDDSNPSILLQMAWPGYALADADFRRFDEPDGSYDPEVAKEVFSALANIAPLLGTTRFENSGLEIDDLYELLILGAIPAGATQATMGKDPRYKLFADAQYAFVQARRGAHDDPHHFYHPCSATPENWYDEAAAGEWAVLTLEQVEGKPTGARTPPLAESGVWHLHPSDSEEDALATEFAEALKRRATALEERVTRRSPAPSRDPVHGPGGLARSHDFDMNRRDLGIRRIADRFVLKRILDEYLPRRPPSPATNGLGISFRFCRIHIDRPWLKLALLNTPGWWMPDTPAGTYSTGTLADNFGLFPLLTTSFIAVRDLKITADWSQADRKNLLNAASFGFFDVRGGHFESNTLEVKGLQVVGWISRLMPMLPPIDPP